MGRDLLATESHMLTLGRKAKAKDADTWPSHSGSRGAVLCPLGTVQPGGLQRGGPARRATPAPMPPVQVATQDQWSASALLTAAVGPLRAGGQGPALLAGHPPSPRVPSLRGGAPGPHSCPSCAALPCACSWRDQCGQWGRHACRGPGSLLIRDLGAAPGPLPTETAASGQARRVGRG